MTTDGCMAKSIADCRWYERCKKLTPAETHPCEVVIAKAREILMDKIEKMEE